MTSSRVWAIPTRKRSVVASGFPHSCTRTAVFCMVKFRMRHITGMFQRCDLDDSGGSRYDTREIGGQSSLVCGTRASRPEVAREENQGRSEQAGATQQPETIERRQERGLVIQDPADLRLCVGCRVSRRETVPCKICGQICQDSLIGCALRSGVGNEDRTMVLRAAGHYRGGKRDTKTGSLISKKICQTGSLVVFVFWQERIGKLAHGNEERGDAQALNRASKCLVLVVGAEIEAGVVPHA